MEMGLNMEQIEPKKENLGYAVVRYAKPASYTASQTFFWKSVISTGEQYRHIEFLSCACKIFIKLRDGCAYYR